MPFLKIPEYWDALLYRFFTPNIRGVPLVDLTIRLDSSIVMVAAGGLMGIRTGMSLLLGAVHQLLRPGSVGHESGASSRARDSAAILMWGMWGGVAMMTTASLFGFFSQTGGLRPGVSRNLRYRRAEDRGSDRAHRAAAQTVGDRDPDPRHRRGLAGLVLLRHPVVARRPRHPAGVRLRHDRSDLGRPDLDHADERPGIPDADDLQRPLPRARSRPT